MSTDMHEPIRTDWRHTPVSRMPKGGADGAKLGGVVAGVSRAYGFDLRSTRIATAVALLILPPLWFFYIAGWVLLPDSPAEAQSLDTLLRDRSRRPLLLVLAAIMVLATLGVLGSWFLFQGAPWGVVLVGFGVLLWASTTDTFAARTGGSATTATPTTPTSPRPEHAAPVTAPLPVGSPFPAPTVHTHEMPVTESIAPHVPAAPRRARRPITTIGVGITTLWFLVVGVGNAVDWWKVDNLWVVVTGIAIVLGAMVVSIVVNRSWVLPFLFLPLAAVLVALCVAQPDIDGPSGQRTVVPSTVAEAEGRQHLSTGELTLDLTDVADLGTGQTVVVDAEVGMGRLHVTVPDDANLVIRTDVGMGQAQLDGQQIDGGIRQTNSRTIAATAAPAGTIELDLRVGMGQIDVTRVAAGA